MPLWRHWSVDAHPGDTQYNPNTLLLQMFAISSFSMLALGGLGHVLFRADTHMCAIEVHYGVGKPKATLSVEHIERQFLVCPTTLDGKASDGTQLSQLNYSMNDEGSDTGRHLNPISMAEHSTLQPVSHVHQSLYSIIVSAHLSDPSVCPCVPYRTRCNKHLWALVCTQRHP
jgi:hypothetical protein